MNPQTPFGGDQQQPYQPQQPVNAGGYPQPPSPYAQPQQSAAPYGQPQVQPQGQPSPFTPQPPVGPSQPVRRPRNASKFWVVFAIVFMVLTLAGASAFVWAYLNYVDNRDNVESKVTAAVNVAVKNQKDKDAADFIEKEKMPNRIFAGPEDYGSLTFNYPKTWSIYVAEDASKGGAYEAYFNPVSVPTVDAKQQYALRVVIDETDFDKELSSYQKAVEKGELKSTSVKINGVDGVRLQGVFSKDITGAAVLFKIRDKTVTVRTDANLFIDPDFNALVKTITFNK